MPERQTASAVRAAIPTEGGVLPGLRARLCAMGAQLRLTRAAGTALRWRSDPPPRLTAHPAAFVHPDFTAAVAACAMRPGSRAPRGLAAALRAAFARTPAADPLWFAQAQGPRALANLAALRSALGDDCQLLCNDNARLLLAVRRRSRRRWELDIHHRFLLEDAAIPDLARFAHRGGHGGFKRLDRVLHRIFDAIRAEAGSPPPPPAVAALPSVGPAPDLAELAAAVHARYFADLAAIPVQWSRGAGDQRRQRSIRFGSFRSRPQPHIRIHPRLRQPWVAQVFLEHVIHHEYCHYRQHCAPLRGEASHSPRFRAWERSFPGYRQALAWERVSLERLLGPVEAGEVLEI